MKTTTLISATASRSRRRHTIGRASALIVLLALLAPLHAQTEGVVDQLAPPAASAAKDDAPENPLTELLQYPGAHVIAAPVGKIIGNLDLLKKTASKCSIEEGSENDFIELVKKYANNGEDLTFPVFVHVVKFNFDSVEGRNAVGKDCWFTVQPGPGGKSVVSSTKRLFGASSFGVLFLHLDWHVSGFTKRLDDESIDAGSCPADGPYGEVADNLTRNFKADSREAFYYGIVEKKLPQNVRNLIALLRAMTITPAADNQSNVLIHCPVSYYGYGYEPQIPRTSDITLFGAEFPVRNSSGSAGLIGQKLEVDNESKHWWDVSIGVPMTKLTALEYSEDNSRFDPKEVNKQTAYGMLNLFWPHDLKEKIPFWYPRALIGIGITGRPGERFFIGGGVGPKAFQVFAGSGFVSSEITLGEGEAQRLGTKYNSQFTMGINISVQSAIDKLSGGK